MSGVSRVGQALRALLGSFWLIPGASVACAVLAGLVLLELDAQLGSDSRPFLFPGGPDGARAVLGAIASSMISLTALVFSITVVVLQLTSSQFSPRILRTFLQDRVSQVALGVFVATFAFAMTVLRAVHGGDGEGRFVPQVATTVAFALVLVSLGVFIWYIQHITNAIRAANILAAVGRETRAVLEDEYPSDRAHVEPQLGPVRQHICADEPGVVSSIDISRLVKLAQRADVLIEMVPCIGTFLPEGTEVFEIRLPAERAGTGEADSFQRLDDRDVLSLVTFSVERTLRQDTAYGFRQLADVAERVLSPSTNDHTTAIQAVDQLHDLFRRLVSRPMPDRVHRDRDGEPRLYVPERGLDHYLEVGVDQVLAWAEDSARVRAHVAAMLRDLISVARPEHLSALEERAARLDRTRAPTSRAS